MNRLKSLSIKGFKSIKALDPPLEFGNLNVLVGANGSGKSNLLSFFGMLNYMTNDSLQKFVSLNGGPETFLHYGAKRTPQIEACLEFSTAKGTNSYEFTLSFAKGLKDELIFTKECLDFRATGKKPNANPLYLGVGHNESALLSGKWIANPTAKTFKVALRGFRLYQFHDTSRLSPLRTNRVERRNHTPFHGDGRNLAAVLFRMSMEYENEYFLLVKTIRLVAPFFRDFAFDLEEGAAKEDDVLMSWISEGSDYRLGMHQLSDGTLRFIALTTLLMLPEKMRPSGAILIDEPELGLHPRALPVLAGLLRNASEKVQIICSTQSADLLSEFDAEHVIVADRKHGESIFNRPDKEKLQVWLDDEFSLGDIWKSNLIGGRPHRD
ncbi:MAG: AAA family ATPase [Akkermansiaceae bacterium]|jgi:predicted ATPase|nr:AAA family ATPase [Akkermansiaceae bacterium]